jgi:hypothetical protein
VDEIVSTLIAGAAMLALGGCWPVTSSAPRLGMTIVGASADWERDERANDEVRLRLRAREPQLAVAINAGGGSLMYQRTEPPFMLLACLETARPGAARSAPPEFAAVPALLVGEHGRYESRLASASVYPRGEFARHCYWMTFQADPPTGFYDRYRLTLPPVLVDRGPRPLPELEIRLVPATSAFCWGTQCLGGH